jgi:short-subunit dehydrogenase
MITNAKSVFITGATSGLGLALALRFVKAGYRVGICGRDITKVEQYADQLVLYQVDVTDRLNFKNAIDNFYQSGGLDIIIANAGIGFEKKTIIPNFEHSRKMTAINVDGVYNTFEFALEHFFAQKKGHLVAVGSVAGFNGLPGVSTYSASKAWVHAICESFSLDFPRHGIDVSCIIPGFVDTPLTRKNKHPMPFLMNCDEAAEVAFKGIEKKKHIIYFPWQMYFITKMMALMPRCLYRKLMQSKRFNYSRS